MPGACGPLLVAHDVVYKWDGSSLTAFDAGGEQVWESSDVRGLPAVVDDRLYVASKHKPALVVIQADTWKQLDEIPVPERPDRPPLMTGDTAHFGTMSGFIVSLNLQDRTVRATQRATRILSPLVKSGPLLIFNAEVPGGFALMACNLETDAVAWSVDTQVLSQACPLVVDSRVFFGSDRLYSVELATGEARSFDMSGGPVGNPVMGEALLHVPGGRFMHAVDPATGLVIAKFGAEEWIDAPPTAGPPVMRDGVVYFGSLDCHVYGVRLESPAAAH